MTDSEGSLVQDGNFITNTTDIDLSGGNLTFTTRVFGTNESTGIQEFIDNYTSALNITFEDAGGTFLFGGVGLSVISSSETGSQAAGTLRLEFVLDVNDISFFNTGFAGAFRTRGRREVDGRASVRIEVPTESIDETFFFSNGLSGDEALRDEFVTLLNANTAITLSLIHI